MCYQFSAVNEIDRKISEKRQQLLLSVTENDNTVGELSKFVTTASIVVNEFNKKL